MTIKQRFISMLNNGSDRSVIVKKNILGSFLNKFLSIAIQLLLIPLTIDYLDSAQYGVWLTISSIVAWITYFDVGLCHGFQNHFTKAVAHNQIEKARQYVSTTYVSLIFIFGLVLLISEVVNPFLDWAEFLKIEDSYNNVLTPVAGILVLCLCCTFVFKIIQTLLIADQRTALSSFITTLGQVLTLVVVLILTRLSHKSMVYLCWALSGIPCLVLIVASIWFYGGKYKQFRPSLKCFKYSLIKDILGLGGKFFVIQVSMLVIFQVVNIIISRVQGPEAVTQYNVAYKYFSIIQMVFAIILAPMWAAYTDAFAKKDFTWMRNIYLKLNKLFIYTVAVSLLMLIGSGIVFRLWIGDSVEIPWALSIAMAIYVLALTYSNMFMILINGIGKVFVQMLIYVVFAIIAIPALNLSCSEYGLPGMLLFLAAVYMAQAVFANIQFFKILNQTAVDIWNK